MSSILILLLLSSEFSEIRTFELELPAQLPSFLFEFNIEILLPVSEVAWLLTDYVLGSQLLG